ncbi:MAG: DUF4416 family protein [Thermodesulfobacteria bacterium]|nr:DUF4416 family protein [Thermodesulfobacteriota bacterium]
MPKKKMSEPTPPKPAQLFFSIFSAREDLIETAIRELEGCLGPREFESPLLNFDKTSYYEKEFGGGLVRRFVFFEKLIPQEKIVPIKHLAYKIEKKHSRDGARTVNIDPGYLLLERLVLVTFKNFSHRIYLGDYVYAEVTLLFSKGEFQPLPWTYPDYADPEAQKIFIEARNRYRDKLKRC